MSMKEYELLRQKYVHNDINSQKNDYICYYDEHNNNQDIERTKWKRSETFNKSNNFVFNDVNIDNPSINHQIMNDLNINSNHIKNIGLKHYDWGSDEKIAMPNINYYGSNLRKEDNGKINSDNNGNKVLNENLFY